MKKHCAQAILVLVVLTLVGCVGVSKQDKTGTETYTVSVQSVTIPTRFNATLRVEGDAGSTPIVPEMSGRVVALLVANGSQVQKGDTLFVLEARKSSEAMNQALVNLKAAEEQERRVTSEYEIIKNLYAHDNVGEEMLSQAGEAYRRAKAATAQAKALVWKADAELVNQSAVAVCSPAAGIVGHISASVGGVVNAGDVIATITDKNKMGLMRGRLDKDIQCTVEIPMQYDNVLVVPQSCIGNIDGQPTVYMVGEDGASIPSPVEVLEVGDGQHAVVLSGLKEGEVIWQVL